MPYYICFCTCLDQVRSDERRTPRYLKVVTDQSGDPFKHKGGRGVFLLLNTSINWHLALLNCTVALKKL